MVRFGERLAAVDEEVAMGHEDTDDVVAQFYPAPDAGVSFTIVRDFLFRPGCALRGADLSPARFAPASGRNVIEYIPGRIQ